jgi:two-component system NtrC family sensor kinase
VDAARIQQVFMNLVLNAIQAMNGGGELNVSIASHADAGRIQVQVTDTGTGIAKKNMDKVFDPFFTTKEQGKGTGLGLAVSYGIVHQHGGDIHVTSTVGKGTTVTVWLPMESSGQKQGDRYGD